MTAAVQITNAGVVAWPIVVAFLVVAGLWLAWAERNDRIPMTEHERDEAARLTNRSNR